MSSPTPGTTRTDRAILIAITAWALVFQLRGALEWPLAVDESWHLFYADVTPWTRAVHEWVHDTHPPLTYALLRVIVTFVDDPFWGRLASIVPGLVQPWLLFLVLRRLDVARPIAHVGVFAFAISHAFTVMSVVIRSYSIGATLSLLAAWMALESMPGVGTPRRGRVAVMLGALALGVWSLYVVGIAAGAIAVVLGGLCLSQRAYGAELIGGVRRVTRPPELLAFALAGCAVFAYYAVTYLHREFYHLDSWLLEDGQDPLAFALNGAVHDLADLSPIDLRGSASAPWIVLGLVAIPIAAGLRAARRGGTPRGIPRGVALLGVPLTGLVFLALALLRMYPFGGDLRHQYPLFVLGLIALFVLLDDVWRALPHRALRAVFCALLVLLSAATTVRSFATTRPEFPPEVVFGDEAEAALEAGDDVPVCVANSVFVALYGRYLRLGWHFVSDDHGWETFETRTPRRTVYRHRPSWTLDPVPGRAFLRSLHDVCTAAGHRAVRLCTPRLDERTSVASRVALEGELRARCAETGFRLRDRAVFARGEVYTLDLAD